MRSHNLVPEKGTGVNTTIGDSNPMRVALINHVLMLATKHQNVNAAIIGRGDKGVSLIHLAHIQSGRQMLLRFSAPVDVKNLEEDKRTADLTMLLGYYTVPESMWNLAKLAEIYEARLIADNKLSEEGLKMFTEQLIERLIMSSTSLGNPSAEMPEGHELWKLCLSGDDQEVFVSSDFSEGGFSMLPGVVLADMSAPKGMPSVIAALIVKERELERMKGEEYDPLFRIVGSLFSGILYAAQVDISDDDSGIGRSFGNN